METQRVGWAVVVADNVRQYTPEPTPPVRGYHAARERARHANVPLAVVAGYRCWHRRRRRADNIRRHCVTAWGMTPQNKWQARNTAHGLR
jgi:hypothetical protein